MTIQHGLPRYVEDGDYPPLVRAGVAASRRLDFEKACTPEVGALLRVLAGRAGRIGETGAACGVGTAWLASGMAPGATLVTVENDDRLAAAATGVLGSDSRVRVVCGEARTVMPEHGPFDLLFTDGGYDKSDPGPILALVERGGLIVMDDLTPERAWSESLRAKYPDGDPLRLRWAEADAFTSELMLTPTESVLLAVRVG